MKRILKILGGGAFKLIAKGESLFDKSFLVKDVPLSKLVSHQKWQKYLYDIGNKEGLRVLEIGSREVTGPSNARKEFSKAEYVGFDFYPGSKTLTLSAMPTNCHPISRRVNSLTLFIPPPVSKTSPCPG